MRGQPCKWATETGQKNPECYGWSECRSGGCCRKTMDQKHRRAKASAYRKFPGKPRAFPDLKRMTGVCTWCEGAVMDPKRPGEVSKRRNWHDGRDGEPDCLGLYYAHTRQPAQLAYLLERDGLKCAQCGDLSGRWTGRGVNPEYLRSYSAAWRRLYPERVYVGRFTQIEWASGLEVDHRLPLGLVVRVIPEAERWRYWGPDNLQGLCRDCHKAKTKADTAAIREAKRAQS